MERLEHLEIVDNETILTANSSQSASCTSGGPCQAG